MNGASFCANCNLVKSSTLRNTILQLFKQDHAKDLRSLIERTHPANLAAVLPSIARPERKALIAQMIDNKQTAKIISRLSDKRIISETLSELKHSRISEIFSYMDADDAADIIGYLPEDESAAVLKLMKTEDAEKINMMLRYKTNTAGGLMNTDYISVKDSVTVEEALKELKRTKHIDNLFYVYAVNEAGALSGALHLKTLMSHPAETKISKIMNERVIFVDTDASQREVINTVNRYHLLALPVVNKDKKIVGIITADDVINVAEREITNDVMRMAGISTSLTPTRARLFWSVIAVAGGLFVSNITAHYFVINSPVSILLTFLPLITIISALYGYQSSSVAVRNIVLDNPTRWDMINCTMLALISFLMSGAGAYFMYPQNRMIVAIISCSVFVASFISSLLGTAIPLLIEKLRGNACYASLPLIMTLNTLINITFYLFVSTQILWKIIK